MHTVRLLHDHSRIPAMSWRRTWISAAGNIWLSQSLGTSLAQPMNPFRSAQHRPELLAKIGRKITEGGPGTHPGSLGANLKSLWPALAVPASAAPELRHKIDHLARVLAREQSRIPAARVLALYH